MRRLFHREAFEFSGFGVLSRCPVSVYLTQDNEHVGLFIHNASRCQGTSVINAFEAAATKLCKELGWPTSMQFYIRIERSKESTCAVPRTEYCRVTFRMMPKRQIEAGEFLHDVSLATGDTLFGIS